MSSYYDYEAMEKEKGSTSHRLSMSKIQNNLILATIIVSTVYFYRYLFSPTIFDDFRLCLATNVYGLNATTMWSQLEESVDNCSIYDRFYVEKIGSEPDRKFFLIPMDDSPFRENCTIVTVTIEDKEQTLFEKTIKAAFKECNLYTFDPVSEIFRRRAEKTGESLKRSTVGPSETTKQEPSSPIISENSTFPETGLLSEGFLPKKTVIDAVTVDLDNSASLKLHQLSSFIICQMNIRFFQSNQEGEKERKEGLKNFVDRILKEKKYTVLKATEQSEHYRLFLVNHYDRQCRERFIFVRNTVIKF